VLRKQVPPLLVIGQTPNASRRVGLIRGGSFEGERLTGEVVSGNDWQAVHRLLHQAGCPPYTEDDK